MVADGNRRAGVALLIGIGDYARSDQVQPLRFAPADAEGMFAVLTDPDVGNFPPDQVLLRSDGKASRDELVYRLSDWLPARAEGAEIVVIYFAGHGLVQPVNGRDEGFLIPHDGDPDKLADSGIAMADLDGWIRQVQARAAAVVVVLDCCHAGKVIPRKGVARRDAARDRGIRPAVLQPLTGKGRFILASCDEGESSYELDDLGHGLFTYHLLRGLEGEGDRDGDGRVGVAELFEHVSQAVKRDAGQKFNGVQRPWASAVSSGGVYLSVPRPRATAPASVQAVERLWREEGAAAAVRVIEDRLPQADGPFLAGAMRLLRRMADPAGVVAAFRCLRHPDEAVREQARQAAQALGWEKTVGAVKDLARAADEETVGILLDGLGTFEASRDGVALLNWLVDHLKGDLRNRALLLLERKRLALELQATAALFREIHSPYQIQKVLGQGLCTAAYLARDEASQLEVVVRVLRPEFAGLPSLRVQFLDLGRRSVHCKHQNLVWTREVREFPERNVYFAVRDYVEGVTLQRLLESGRRFTAAEVLKVLRQVLEALTPLHRAGACHSTCRARRRAESLWARPAIWRPNRPRARARRSGRQRTCTRWGPFSTSV